MKKIHLFVSDTDKAHQYAEKISQYFSITNLEDADVAIVLGGDGFMLQTMHQLIQHPHCSSVALFGVNCGTIGFLMNECALDDIYSLDELIHKASKTKLSPLQAEITTLDGSHAILRAFNEITLHRQTHQACHIEVRINDIVRINSLVGDGVLLSTPQGSSAYNYSAGGPIIPIESKALVLTPLNAYKPRRWPGAILDERAHVTFNIIHPLQRLTNLTADWITVPSIKSVTLYKDAEKYVNVLFNTHHNLEARILAEQFWS